MVLSYTDMNPPWVYMCSPSWTPPPTSLLIPSLWVIPVHQPQAPCIMHRLPGLAICFTYDNIFVSMPFSQIIPLSPSPTESKTLFYTSVFLLLSCIPPRILEIKAKINKQDETVWMFYPFSILLLLHQFLLLDLSIFVYILRCFDVRFTCIYNCYVIMLNWPSLSLCNLLCF